MNEANPSLQFELKLARGLTADLTLSRILKTLVPLATCVLFLICAIELLSILGQIGYVGLPMALALVAPLYWMSLLKLWDVFGVG